MVVSRGGKQNRLKNANKENSRNINNVPVTEGQTTAVGAVTGQTTDTPISVTSPMPTQQFLLNGTPAAIADFKEKEKVF